MDIVFLTHVHYCTVGLHIQIVHFVFYFGYFLLLLFIGIEDSEGPPLTADIEN